MLDSSPPENKRLPSKAPWSLVPNGQGIGSEYLPVGDTINPVTYALTSRTSSNAPPIQTVNSVRDLDFSWNLDLVPTIALPVLPKKSVEYFFTQRHDPFELSKGRAYGSWRYFVA